MHVNIYTNVVMNTNALYLDMCRDINAHLNYYSYLDIYILGQLRYIKTCYYFLCIYLCLCIINIHLMTNCNKNSLGNLGCTLVQLCPKFCTALV